MKDSRSHLPIRYRAVNAVGRLLVTAGTRGLLLDEQALCEAAINQTELTDFGDPYFREGLQQLLNSAEEDANLHPLGRLIFINMVTNFMVQRLRMVETRTKEQKIFKQPLIPPLIIIGPARSGTTFLHNLLAQDPAHRALPQWLLMYPFPEGPGNDNSPDPRLIKAEQGLRFRLPLLPGLDSIHYSRADSFEEDIIMLGLTLHSLVFFTLFPVYSYQEWYLKQEELSMKYREYRWLLQVFQDQESERRLTLKAPAHTGSLAAILEEVPQAKLIMTHRDPVACISSACSLLYTFHLGVADEIDIQRMAKLLLRSYETLGKRNIAFREDNLDVIFDVYYDNLVSDPIGTVQGIYSHLDLPWPEDHETVLKDYIARNKKDKHGKHRYSPSDFGLEKAEVTERMKFYYDNFEI
ncbi:MAG: sulfotransferase [Chloroflexota bacterium]|nr:MAG: sulfotransferase [Chloroflexota bacterium]